MDKSAPWKIPVDTQRCSAKSKQRGEQCMRWVQPGKRVCYYHGGAKGSGRPRGSYTTTKSILRYSASLTNPEERELYEKFRDDPQLEEIGNEIALARMKLARYVEQQDGKLDQRTLDNVLGFTDAIGRIVERRHKITYGEQMTIRTKDFDWLAGKVLEIARKIYGDDDRYQRFLVECSGLAVAAQSRTGTGG